MRKKSTNKCREGQRSVLNKTFCITTTQEKKVSLLSNGDILHQDIPEDCNHAHIIGNFVFYCDKFYVKAFGAYDGGELITHIPEKISLNEIEEYSAKQYNKGTHIIVWNDMIMICNPFEVAVYTAHSGKIKNIFSEKVICKSVKVDAETYQEEKVVKISYKTDENADVFLNSDGEEVEISFLPKKRD